MSTEPSLQTLVGMNVSHIWFSDYAICYFELGALSAGRVLSNGRIGNPRGEVTLFLGYDWSAKIRGVKLSRLYLHAHMNERDVLETKILDQIIKSICLVEPNFEIEIILSNGVTVTSVLDDEHSGWSVGFNSYPDGPDGHLSIEDGKLQFLSGNR